MGNFDAPSWPFDYIQPSRAYQISYSLYCVDGICRPPPPLPPPPPPSPPFSEAPAKLHPSKTKIF